MILCIRHRKDRVRSPCPCRSVQSQQRPEGNADEDQFDGGSDTLRRWRWCYSLHIFGASIRSRLGRDFIRLVSMRVRLYFNADCYLGTKRYAWGVSHKCDSSVCKQLGHTTGPYLGNILYWKIEAGVSLPAIFSTLWGTTTLWISLLFTFLSWSNIH